MVLQLHVIGQVNDPEFHRCCASAKQIAQDCAGVSTTITPLFETDYKHALAAQQQRFGGDIWKHTARYHVLADNKQYVGVLEDLHLFAQQRLPEYTEGKDSEADWTAVAKKELIAMTDSPLVYMDIDAGVGLERIVFELNRFVN
jgi:hypothetical protein